jgi:hypothetical protein
MSKDLAMFREEIFLGGQHATADHSPVMPGTKKPNSRDSASGRSCGFLRSNACGLIQKSRIIVSQSFDMHFWNSLQDSALYCDFKGCTKSVKSAKKAGRLVYQQLEQMARLPALAAAYNENPRNCHIAKLGALLTLILKWSPWNMRRRQGVVWHMFLLDSLPTGANEPIWCVFQSVNSLNGSVSYWDCQHF